MSNPELSASEHAVTAAREAWGDHYTRAIFGQVIYSINRANDLIKPPKPVDKLKIQIADIPLESNGIKTARLWGLHSYWSGFDLLMDSKDPQAVLDEVEVTVFHETARVRIFQQRIINGYYKDNSELDTLGIVIEDGMVIATVEELLGINAYNLEKYMSYGIPNDTIHEYIAAYTNAADPFILSDSEYHGIHMGSPDLPRAGYKIGHAIVRSAMQQHSLSVDEMLSQPPDYYSDHAKTLVK